MRVSSRKVNQSLKKQIIKMYLQVLVDIKNEAEMEIFARDFFTPSELETYAKRLAVLYWLRKGRSYANIRENLKVSSATVAAVAEIANTQGVKLALKKIEAEEWANKWSEKIRKFVGK